MKDLTNKKTKHGKVKQTEQIKINFNKVLKQTIFYAEL